MARGGNRILTWSVVVVWCIAAGLGVTYWITEVGGHTGSPTTSAIATTTTSSAPLTTTTRPAPNSPLTIALGGDIVCDSILAAFIDEEGGDKVLAEVMPLFAPAGMAVVSLVTPISGTPAAPSGAAGEDAPDIVAAPASLVEGLSSAELDAVSLAGSYMLASGPQGLFDTIANLEGATIAHAGAGGNLVAARSAAFIEAPTGVVALLSFGEPGEDARAAGETEPGINPLGVDEPRMLADIAAAKGEADWLIVTLRWQSVTSSTVETEQRRIAHRVVDAGADLVLGSCPHVIQGIEVYRNKPIAYSLGDLAFGKGAGSDSLVLSATLPPAGAPGSFEVIPLVLGEGGVPMPATGEEAAETLSWLARSSSKWDVTLTIRDGRAVYTPPQ